MTETNNSTAVRHYDNPYVAWLVCLYVFMAQVRSEGLMSIECDVDCPEKSNLLKAFPETAQEPYRVFATDLLRMMVGGNLESADLNVYAETAINSQLAANTTHGNHTDEALLRTIWLTLWATLKGYAPQVAIEYGRQAVPLAHKPDYAALNKLAKEAYSVWRRPIGSEDSLDAQIESFIASLCR